MVLAGFVLVHLNFWQTLDVPLKPGPQSAAELIVAQRQPGEPVVVSSTWVYFSLLYYAPDRADWRVYTPDGRVVHYGGAAALQPAELCTSRQLNAITSARVWVVDTEGLGYGAAVPVPGEWVQLSQERFPDTWVGEDVKKGAVVVRQYRTRSSAYAPANAP